MNAVQWFKCLADPTRLYTTLLLSEMGELCVCDLVTALELSQPKISRHLAPLRLCNIVEDRRDGHWVYYKLDSRLPAWAIDSLKLVLVAEAQTLKPMIMRLKKQACRA